MFLSDFFLLLITLVITLCWLINPKQNEWQKNKKNIFFSLCQRVDGMTNTIET